MGAQDPKIKVLLPPIPFLPASPVLPINNGLLHPTVLQAHKSSQVAQQTATKTAQERGVFFHQRAGIEITHGHLNARYAHLNIIEYRAGGGKKNQVF